MRIAPFLELARTRILEEAIAFARTIPVLSQTTDAKLRDHLPQVLEAISADLRTAQTSVESIEKSHGLAPEGPAHTSAQTHGLLRAQDGINVEQLVAEFRALRSSILRLWLATSPMGPDALDDIVRFNEAIDQAVAESVQFHSDERERWRHIFLGVLGHDLRGPLSAVALTIELMRKQSLAPVAHTALLARGVGRITSLLDSLLKYNRASLGTGMELQRAAVDLGVVCAEELELQRAVHADASINFTVSGEADGVFDASRVREALANLVSNAVKHGQDTSPVVVRVDGDATSVRVSVDNAGDLPAQEIEGLFEPLRRREGFSSQADRTHLGLGLFIVRQIARAHGGDVAGSCASGQVRFTLVLPKAV